MRTTSTAALRTARGCRADIALVIAASPRATAIGDAYRANGYDVYAPATPLDVIQTLITVGERIDTVVIAEGAHWAHGLDEFIAEEFPGIARASDVDPGCELTAA